LNEMHEKIKKYIFITAFCILMFGYIDFFFFEKTKILIQNQKKTFKLQFLWDSFGRKLNQNSKEICLKIKITEIFHIKFVFRKKL